MAGRPSWSGLATTRMSLPAYVDLNNGLWAELRFRHQNANNCLATRLGRDTGGGTGPIKLIEVVSGVRSVLSETTYTRVSAGTSITLKVKVDSSDNVVIWTGATQKISYTSGLEIDAGGVALAGDRALFDNVKVSYDNNADDDLDSAGDDWVINETTALGYRVRFFASRSQRHLNSEVQRRVNPNLVHNRRASPSDGAHFVDRYRGSGFICGSLFFGDH